MNPDARFREQLKAIDAQLASLRAEKTEARRERDEAKKAFSDADFTADGNPDIFESAEFKASEKAVEKVGELEDRLGTLEANKMRLLQTIGDGAGASSSHDANPLGKREFANAPFGGWDAQSLLANSDDFKYASANGMFSSNHQFGTVNVGEMCGRDEFRQFLAAALPAAPAANIGTPASSVPQDYRGIIQPYVGPLSVLDVIPTGTTDSNLINYVQVTALPGYAAETAELTPKPQEGITLVDATAPVRTIAGYQKAARQALADLAGLASLINMTLPWDVRRRLQQQIINGNGTGQNLTGILSTAGIGAPVSAAGDGDPIGGGLLRAITAVVLSDADPTVMVMNPLTWQNLLLAKATTSEYLSGPPGAQFSGAYGTTYWGLRVVLNRYCPQATPFVFDPGAMMLLIREGVNIRTSDSDQDDFINNRVTVLAETRVAFPVWRPSAIAQAPLG